MALKTNVVDRIPRYPGRVTMTPVSGQANTYDMVRADSPTQEGTPINKALFDKKADALTSDVTLYVTKSGNDTSGDGTSAKPYLTIQKAIDTIPKNLNGYVASVHISPGTYNEAVAIEHFCGGRVVLTGETTTTCTLTQQMTIRNCNVHFEYLTMKFSGTFVYVIQGATLYTGDSANVEGAGGTYVIHARYNAKVTVMGDLIANNVTTAAVRAGSSSDIYIHRSSGAGNKVGFSAGGGHIRINGTTMAATTLLATVSGGRIYNGAQENAPNY